MRYEDTQHPRLERSEAEARLRRHGYVRMDGHTATDQEQLDRLYDAIFPAMDGGTYSEPRPIDEAIAEAKASEAEAVVAATKTKKGKAAAADEA